MDGLVLKVDDKDGTTSGPGGSSSKSTTIAPTPASPLEASEAYENICGICFTEIHPVDNPRGRLNSCNHLFCSYCIKEWAKNTNVCPSCKARFTRIYTFNTATQQEEETKVRRRNYKAWELSYYDDDSDDDEEEWEDAPRHRRDDAAEQVVCDICQQSHNAARMIFCDRRQCPYAAHLDCLGLAERPVTFLCPQCTQLREQEGNTAGASSSSSATGDVVAKASAPTQQQQQQHPSPQASGSARAVAATQRRTARGAPLRNPASVLTAAATAAHRANGRHLASPGDQPGQSRALYGGSRSTSSASSSSSSPPTPSRAASPFSRRTGTSAPPPPAPAPVPRQPVDFSKPHIPPLPSVTTQGRGQRTTPASAAPATTTDDMEDDYYFLAPTSHAVAATIELARTKASRAAEAQTRRQRERAKAERLESAFGVNPQHVQLHAGRKRPQGTIAETFNAELEAAEKAFTDPQQRRVMEESMVRRWAADILPVLRRRRYIDGDTATSEAEMWTQATAQARKMVQEKLDAKGASLRRRREQMVRAQANREAAALAKLARIIAQHREREQQQQQKSQT